MASILATSLACLLICVAAVGECSGGTSATRDQRIDLLNEALGKEKEVERLRSQGRYSEAVPRAQEAVELYERALGLDNPLVSFRLVTLASLLNMTGDHSAARPLFERAIRIQEQAFGPDHPVLVSTLGLLAFNLWSLSDRAAARLLAERALRIREQAVGPDHPDVATSLHSLAFFFEESGDSAAAQPLYERALRIREQALGPDHPEVAASLRGLASLLRKSGNIAAAQPLYERALRIRERGLGPDHPDVAESLNDLAGVLAEAGDYAGAKQLYERALRIREKTLGPMRFEVAENLGGLAEVLRQLGDFTAARPMFERALKVYEQALGPNHPLVTSALYNLGLFLETVGDYQGAKAAQERSLTIREQTRGPMHPDVATSLSSLAGFSLRTGDYVAARSFFERALEIREHALGPNHPNTASSLFDLAQVHRARGDYALAMSFYERALAIREGAFGATHLDVAASLRGLGGLLEVRGEHAAAKPLLERALTIREKKLGPDHPEVARILRDLASLQRVAGDRDAARSLYQRAIRIFETTLGAGNPDTVTTLGNLALLEWESGHPDVALPMLIRAITSAREHIYHNLAGLSIRQKLGYIERMTPLIADLFSEPPEYVHDEVAYRALLDWKNSVFRNLVEERTTVEENPPPAVVALLGDYRSVRRQLAVAHFSETAASDPRESHLRIERLTKRLEEVEGELSRTSARFRRNQTEESAGPAEVCAGLPKDSALIELFRYDRRELSGTTSSPWYVAFVLRGGDCGNPIRVELGLAAPIDEEVGRLREALSRGASDQAAQVLQTRYRQGVAARVYAKLFPPTLQHAIAGKPRLVIAPNGLLALLPFGLLPGEDGHEFLLETRTISYVPSGRDLLRPVKESPSARSFLAVGAPAFDRAPAQTVRATTAVRAGCGVVDDSFAPLPGSRMEVRAIAKVYEKSHPGAVPMVLQGQEATKAAILAQAPKASVLHLATHAYFAGEECTPVRPTSPAVRTLEESAGFLGFNPLLLAGIALVGANRPDKADGILTALEITALDLRHTNLVVLSACDTGLGTLARGQELLGLRWAFAYAGARSLVTSLWSVPDAETATLMSLFYTGLWDKGLSVADALRAAQLEMLKAARAAGDGRPSSWGAFVVSGTGGSGEVSR